MGNSFEVRENARQQHLKERPAPQEDKPIRRGGLELEARKRRKQTYTVYLDRDLMSKVQRLAKEEGVAASAVIEACVKMSLEQLEK